jgi:hypothetical protein
MFRIVSLIAIVSLALFLLGLRLTKGKRPTSASSYKRPLVEWAALAGTSISFLYLALSGFYASIVVQSPLQGYLLLGHVSAGIVFAASLVALAVLWAESCRFVQAVRADSSDSSPIPAEGRPFSAGKKLFFWCFLAAGLTSALTVLLSMTPLFGTPGMDLLAEVHRWSALVSVLAAMGFVLSR